MAATVEQVVAMRVGIQMAAGSAEPAAARSAMVPVGAISVIAAVLMARKSTIESVATPGCGFRRESSLMALRPKGVAALPMPSTFEAKFITMAPMAG